MKRGRPKIKKIPIDSARVSEAIEYRETSLRKMDIDPAFGYSEKTVRRALQEGMVNPEILDALGRYLDVDPLFLSGGYDRRAEVLSNLEVNDDLPKIPNHYLDIEFHPYANKTKRDTPAFEYIRSLLDENGIAQTELDNLDRAEQIRFLVEMDRAVSKVIWDFFDRPKEYSFEYSIPMPPEEEIYHAK